MGKSDILTSKEEALMKAIWYQMDSIPLTTKAIKQFMKEHGINDNNLKVTISSLEKKKYLYVSAPAPITDRNVGQFLREQGYQDDEQETTIHSLAKCENRMFVPDNIPKRRIIPLVTLEQHMVKLLVQRGAERQSLLPMLVAWMEYFFKNPDEDLGKKELINELNAIVDILNISSKRTLM